jgi:hypothetical protein
MPRRPVVRLGSVQQRWRDSPLKGGVVGILSVALATAVIAAACAAIALVVTLAF